MVLLEGLPRLQLSKLYNSLLNREINSFVAYANGNLMGLVESPFYFASKLDVFPGSYNPLHDGHRAIYDLIDNRFNEVKLFEISVERLGKSNLSAQDIEERVSQFRGYAHVLITNAPRIIHKAGLLRHDNLIFHIGIDTYDRMLEDYGPIGIQGIAGHFKVYDRKINDRVESFASRPNKPINCSQGQARSESLLGISSTNIRACHPKE